jgi:soluble lytic murein transglycosylase-like protein
MSPAEFSNAVVGYVQSRDRAMQYTPTRLEVEPRRSFWRRAGVFGVRVLCEAAKLFIGFVLACIVLLEFLAPYARAQVPVDATRYKLDLRRQAQLVWGLDAPVATFAAQIHQESRWRADARSPVGAQGLAQFMPATARWISGAYAELGDNAPYNPTWAIRALVTYDKHLYDRVKAANHCERMAYALAGYNGGLGWVYKRQKLSPEPLVCLGKTCELNPGIHPANQRENAEYPRRILLQHEPLYVRAGWGNGSCT